jgi:Ala-tRNA(Pro) deacylase
MDYENECYKILKKLNISYESINYTKEEKENKELIDEKIGVKGIKNLLFKTRNLKKDLFLVILPREKRFDTKAFRNKYNITKIEMVTDEELDEFLSSKTGEVSIIDLINDKDKRIKLYIDKEVLDEKYFRFHPYNGLVTVKITTKDLIDKLIPYLDHELNII